MPSCCYTKLVSVWIMQFFELVLNWSTKLRMQAVLLSTGGRDFLSPFIQATFGHHQRAPHLTGDLCVRAGVVYSECVHHGLSLHYRQKQKEPTSGE